METTISQQLLGIVPSNYDEAVRKFSLNDLRVESKRIFLGEERLAEIAVKSVLSEIGISQSCIKKATLTVPEWGDVVGLLSKGNHKTYHLHKVNDALYGLTTASFKGVSAEVIAMIESLDKVNFGGLEPSGFAHDRFTNTYTVDFLGNEQYEVINADFWKVGLRIHLNSESFYVTRLFKRLTCMNGAMVKVAGGAATIKSKAFSPLGLNKAIELQSKHAQQDLVKLLADASTRATNTNASVREFLAIKSEMDALVGDPIIHGLSVDYLNSAYNTVVEDQHKTWQSTADSGMTVYDLHNKATWISSHEYGLSEIQSRTLALKATSLLFSPTLDMNNVAPKVQIILP